MRHREHPKAFYASYGDPSKFACLDSILIEDSERVCKDKRRRLKTHTMFSQIGSRFGRIPFKAQSHAFMLLQIRILNIGGQIF